jgi:hypothetical protein
MNSAPEQLGFTVEIAVGRVASDDSPTPAGKKSPAGFFCLAGIFRILGHSLFDFSFRLTGMSQSSKYRFNFEGDSGTLHP